jgi:hypothetical protein
MWHAFVRVEAYTGFWWRILMERDYFGDTCVIGKITLKSNFMKLDVEAWSGLIWLRIKTVGDNLRKR